MERKLHPTFMVVTCNTVRACSMGDVPPRAHATCYDPSHKPGITMSTTRHPHESHPHTWDANHAPTAGASDATAQHGDASPPTYEHETRQPTGHAPSADSQSTGPHATHKPTTHPASTTSSPGPPTHTYASTQTTAHACTKHATAQRARAEMLCRASETNHAAGENADRNRHRPRILAAARRTIRHPRPSAADPPPRYNPGNHGGACKSTLIAFCAKWRAGSGIPLPGGKPGSRR